MFDFSLDAMTVKAVVTLLILAAAMYGFVSERLAPDVTALLALLSLLLTGVLTPYEAFSGFSHPATISVAAVLVLSAGVERTGALTFIARRLLTPLGNSELTLTIVIMVTIGSISAFINNTAAVAIFISVVMEVCRRTAVNPSRIDANVARGNIWWHVYSHWHVYESRRARVCAQLRSARVLNTSPD